MSIARLKSLVIAVLVLINLFFATAIILNRVGGAAEQGRIIESLRTAMSASGITFSDDAIRDVTVLDAYTTSQDAFAEAVIARTILGDCEPVQSDSGQKYAGTRGTASFNTLGEFVIELTESYSPSGSSAERISKKLLKNMGIDTTEPVATVFGNTTVVVALCTWRGSQIFNCTVTFTFSGSELVRVEGRRPSDVSETQVSSYITFSTAVLSFLRYDKSQETSSAVITSIDPGYRMNVSAFGDGLLTPGWLIVTDTGVFFANAITGEILRNDI